MSKPTPHDQMLLRMPSLRAIKCFVAAARYQSFTRAAETLCVTQAAISRQIRELEEALGTPLFHRVGRSVELTHAGTLLFDAAQMSFINIAQATSRIRTDFGNGAKRTLTLCCTPAFAALWMQHHLPDFFVQHPDIDLNLVTTQQFLHLEPGTQPDIFITKLSHVRDGYISKPLFHDRIYPVCSPAYLAAHPEVGTLGGLRDSNLLNLGPYGRAQVAEHVDWQVWLGMHHVDLEARPRDAGRYFNTNDYSLLIQFALAGQGVALGWEHLVRPLLDDGRLVQPLAEEVVLEDTRHYLAYREDRHDDVSISSFRDWFLAKKGIVSSR